MDLGVLSSIVLMGMGDLYGSARNLKSQAQHNRLEAELNNPNTAAAARDIYERAMVEIREKQVWRNDVTRSPEELYLKVNTRWRGIMESVSEIHNDLLRRNNQGIPYYPVYFQEVVNKEVYNHEAVSKVIKYMKEHANDIDAMTGVLITPLQLRTNAAIAMQNALGARAPNIADLRNPVSSAVRKALRSPEETEKVAKQYRDDLEKRQHALMEAANALYYTREQTKDDFKKILSLRIVDKKAMKLILAIAGIQIYYNWITNLNQQSTAYNAILSLIKELIEDLLGSVK